MAGYQKPGISITEVETPNTTIVLDRPTVVGLVGEARGSEVRREVIRLVDNDEYALIGANVITTPASSFVVRDINRLNTVYEQGSDKDYVVTTDSNGISRIKRSLYTRMRSRESVVSVIKTTSPSAIVSRNVTFSYANPTEVVSPENGGTISTAGGGGTPGATDISIQRAGKYRLGLDYTVNLSNGRIARADATYGPQSEDCHIMNGQTVYVSYTTDSGENEYLDEIVVLSGTTQTSLANESQGVDTDSIIVRNRSGLLNSVEDVFIFTDGPNGNPDVDFEFEFSPSSAAPENFVMRRNIFGPTTMGIQNNNVDVSVDYSYIPRDYYAPTVFYSFQEVEAKYGPAFDSDGDIESPLSAAAYMCFRAGSNEIVTQALYTVDVGGMRVPGDATNTAHWTRTLESLQGQTAINVLVPAVAQDAVITDETVAAIQNTFVNHINFMRQDNEYVIAIFGEDSTRDGTVVDDRASTETLRQHARILGQQLYPEQTVLVGPSSFRIVNPITGRGDLIGGQYVAAALAGMLANRPVQSSLTRSPVPGVVDVAVFKNESEKNEDAAAGLLVIENKNGVTRVRHGITTAVGDATKRELNAMRSKFFMIESIRRSLDENIIGKIIADATAPFLVSTNVTGLLEFLKNAGALTGYSSVEAVRSRTSPTQMTVRFSYSLPYTINNIEVALSLDGTTGTISAQ